MTKAIKTLILILFSIGAMAMAGSAVFAITWILKDGGSYWQEYGTFNHDAYCGLRGSCHWGYNKQQPAPPTCWGYDEP